MSSSAPCDGGIVCWFNVSHFDLFNKKTQYYSSTPCDGGIACWFNVSHFDLLKKKILLWTRIRILIQKPLPRLL